MTKYSRKSVLALTLSAALMAPLAMAQNTSPATDASQNQAAATARTQVPATPGTPAVQGSTQTIAVPNDTMTQTSTTQASAPLKSTTNTGQKSWNDLDTDKDGNISRAEADADPGMKAIFAKADANGDGILTPDEYRAYYAKYQASVIHK